MLLNVNIRTLLCVEKYGKLEYKDKKKCRYRAFVDRNKNKKDSKSLYLFNRCTIRFL